MTQRARAFRERSFRTPPRRWSLRPAFTACAGLLALISSHVGPLAAGVTFRGVEMLPVGGPQTWAVAADFNRDGVDDLVFTPFRGDTVTLFSSQCRGRFLRSTIQGEFENSLHAATGFVDADGLEDLAVCYRGGVRLYLSNGNGTFTEGEVLRSIFLTRAVWIVDASGDRHPDVLLGDEQAGALRVYLGDGTGHFALRGDFGVNLELHDFDVADLNGDGRLDVVTAHGNDDAVGILLGLGEGDFGVPGIVNVLGNARYVAAGDLDGDGKVDVAVSQRSASTVSLWNGKGDGTLEGGATLPTVPSPEVVETLDFDGDLRLDLLAVGGLDSGALALHKGAAGGAFADPVFEDVGKSPLGVTAADFNADGARDAIVASRGTDHAFVVLGDGKGGFVSPPRIPVGGSPTRLVSADLNGDSKLDFVLARRDQGGLGVLPGGEGGTFGDLQVIEGESIPSDIAVGDFTGDGLPDLAACDLLGGGTSGRVSSWVNLGDWTFAPARTFPSGLLSIALCALDFTGDGKLDLAVANQGSKDLSLLEGIGDGGFAVQTRLALGSVPIAIAAGDWSGDGRADLSVLEATGPSLAIFWNDGQGGFIPGASVPCGANPAALACGDLDGDSKPDLAVADSGAGAILLFRGVDGDPFPAPETVLTLPGPTSLQLMDLDAADGLDLVAASLDAGGAAVHSSGSGSYLEFRAYFTGASPAAVACGDFSGDGLPDIATADSGSDRLTILVAEARSSPPEEIFRRGLVNGDGRLDISDPVSLLGYLFLGGAIADCPDAADANDDGRVDLSDAVYLLGFLFLGGDPPRPPGHLICCTDPTPDQLGACNEPCLP